MIFGFAADVLCADRGGTPGSGNCATQPAPDPDASRAPAPV